MASQETQQQTQGSSDTDRDQPPLWEHMTKLQKIGASGGAWKFSCKFCGETRQGSYSRVKAHLLGIKEEGMRMEKAESSRRRRVACEAGVGCKKRKGSSTPLMVYSEDSPKGLQHRDAEISQERMKCFRRVEFFLILTSISMMGTMKPKSWWVNIGAQTPFLQTLAFRLLGQPTSSSCVERNWSTYAFIHSLRRNKLTTSHGDVGGDAFDSMEDVEEDKTEKRKWAREVGEGYVSDESDGESSSRAALSPGNTECSNCKLLTMKIKILEARLAMEKNPDDHPCESAAILHELLNEMENLRVE
ncbi:hAT dimerization domain, ribonuclease H-like domain protein [Tanacetum coccineum]